jgi:hypothetical protein
VLERHSADASLLMLGFKMPAKGETEVHVHFSTTEY